MLVNQNRFSDGHQKYCVIGAEVARKDTAFAIPSGGMNKPKIVSVRLCSVKKKAPMWIIIIPAVDNQNTVPTAPENSFFMFFHLLGLR